MNKIMKKEIDGLKSKINNSEKISESERRSLATREIVVENQIDLVT